MDSPLAAAAQFTPPGRVLEARPCGQGNVNDTYLVTLEGAKAEHFILQRLNTRVFPRPELIMGNLGALTAHVEARLKKHPLTPGRRWDTPRALLSRDGEDRWLEPDGSFWRALTFIADAQSYGTIQNLEHAREVGWALGLFHRLLSDLNPARLADTLPGFHLTPQYFKHYDVVLAQYGGKASPEADFCRRFLETRRAGAAVLEDAKAKGQLPLRIIHGDPKVNNVMLDTATEQAVALVDLDTVKPGLVHYDLGDCLRSGCNTLGEEIGQWEKTRFDLDICRAILGGYLSQAGDFLTPPDYDYLFDAIRLLPFELGLRFFTDYLEGNVYFKVRDENHNLLRALVQFQLTASIEAQEEGLRSLVRDLSGGGC